MVVVDLGYEVGQDPSGFEDSQRNSRKYWIGRVDSSD